MKYTVSILSEARADIDLAFTWYELKQKGLGDIFFRILNQSVLIISRNPNSFEEIYKGVRRMVIRKFPYGIYYRINLEISEIQIIGVIHFHRNTRVIQKKI